MCGDVWFAFVCLLLGCVSSTCVLSVSYCMLLYGMCVGVRLCVLLFTCACVRCLCLGVWCCGVRCLCLVCLLLYIDLRIYVVVLVWDVLCDAVWLVGVFVLCV